MYCQATDEHNYERLWTCVKARITYEILDDDIFYRCRFVAQMKPANRLGVWNVAYVVSFKCKLQIHYVATERETTLTCNVVARSKEYIHDIFDCFRYVIQMKPENKLGVWNVAYVMSFKKLQMHYVATERGTTLTSNVVARSKESVSYTHLTLPTKA